MNAALEGSCHCGLAGWTLECDSDSITACNCTSCRRYGALWAYDYENERITVGGQITAYRSRKPTECSLETCFCPTCENVLYWRGLTPELDGRRRMAVNVRLAPPEAVAALQINHFDS